uniref:SGNH hydrolase-type esterase domain-containing protein n=1 Tax=Stegastes partitus TaxID=144197 RepID=A0A3B5A9A4_9TELE
MAPLTSPSGCVSCSFLAEKVTELEQRISTLHQIREAELLMDTIVIRTTQPELESSTTSISDVAPAVAPSLPVSGVCSPNQAAAAPPRITEPDATWSRQGAEPKTLSTSTPCEPASWTLVAPRHRRAPSKSSPSPVDLRNSSPASPRPLFPPTTLIIGDSITRNIRFFNATTRCFPGATFPVILAKLPGIIQTLPSSVRRIIVHAGCTDASRSQSEVTKSDFIKLFQYLRTCGKAVFISGPIPPYNRGCGLFSRNMSLNSWLISACKIHNLAFIDNFNLFWNRSTFYRTDGIHPNKLGSSVLAGNILYAVQTLSQ